MKVLCSRYIFYSKNPELVLCVLLKHQKRCSASGIADGLAIWVEACSDASEWKTMLGQRQTLAGVAIAQRCEETLFADGLQAMAACEASCNPCSENIISQHLLSGIGFGKGVSSCPCHP